MSIVDKLVDAIKAETLRTTTLDVYHAERAVIKAAEALLVDKLPLQLRVDRIVDAVRAMQRARGE